MYFPVEIFLCVSSFCDNNSLLKLALLNKNFYKIFHPIIRKNIIHTLHEKSNCSISLLSQLNYIESKLFFKIISFLPHMQRINHIRFTNSFINKNSYKLYFNNYSINVILSCDFNYILFNDIILASSFMHPLYKREISFSKHVFPLSKYSGLINQTNNDFSILFYYAF